jgi:hypothetical protein
MCHHRHGGRARHRIVGHRELQALQRKRRLMAPTFAKPYVKRYRNMMPLKGFPNRLILLAFPLAVAQLSQVLDHCVKWIAEHH